MAIALFAGPAVLVPVESVWVDADLFDADGPLGGWDVSTVERVAWSVGEAGVVGVDPRIESCGPHKEPSRRCRVSPDAPVLGVQRGLRPQ